MMMKTLDVEGLVWREGKVFVSYCPVVRPYFEKTAQGWQAPRLMATEVISVPVGG